MRPNSGIIDPKSVVEIGVTLQPFSYDINEKNKHKFMVQSISAPDGEVNIESLWKEAEPGSIMEYKLRCIFENPVENREEGTDFGNVYTEEKAKRIPEEEILRLRFGQQAGDQHENQTRDSDISLTMIVALAIITALLGIALGKFVL